MTRVRPALRLVRNPNIISFWQGKEFVLEDYVNSRRIRAAPLVVLILDAFSDPRAVNEVACSLPPYSAESVARQIRQLKKLGFLLPLDAGKVCRDLTALWGDSLAASYFHFTVRNVRYVTDRVEKEAYLRRRLAEAAQPPLFKQKPASKMIPLGKEAISAPAVSLSSVLNRRRTIREFERRPVPFSTFAAVIRGTWGQTGWIDGGILGRLLAKTSPSAGARHPIECYALAWNVEDVSAGIYHYNVKQNSLERSRAGDVCAEAVRIASGQNWIRNSAFVCVMTAVADRTFWKYPSSAAYRAFYLDAGHLAQTFALLATAHNLGSFCTAALEQRRIEQLLGIDGVREFPVYLCGAGMPANPRA